MTILEGDVRQQYQSLFRRALFLLSPHIKQIVRVSRTRRQVFLVIVHPSSINFEQQDSFCRMHFVMFQDMLEACRMMTLRAVQAPSKWNLVAVISARDPRTRPRGLLINNLSILALNGRTRLPY